MLSLRLEESVIRLLAGKHQGGLSIAELLVASGLLAVVLVTVMTLFGQLLKNTNKNFFHPKITKGHPLCEHVLYVITKDDVPTYLQ